MIAPGQPRTCIYANEYSPNKTTVSALVTMLEELCSRGLGDKEVFIAPEGKPCKIKRISILSEGAYQIVID